MSDTRVNQRCPLSPTLVGLYFAKLKTYLDEINGDSMCLFTTVVAILLMLMMLFYSLNLEYAYNDL
jgi:hypothetical protein